MWESAKIYVLIPTKSSRETSDRVSGRDVQSFHVLPDVITTLHWCKHLLHISTCLGENALAFLYPEFIWTTSHSVALIKPTKPSFEGKHLLLLGGYNLLSPKELRAGIQVETTEEHSLLDCFHWLVQFSFLYLAWWHCPQWAEPS